MVSRLEIGFLCLAEFGCYVIRDVFVLELAVSCLFPWRGRRASVLAIGQTVVSDGRVRDYSLGCGRSGTWVMCGSASCLLCHKCVRCLGLGAEVPELCCSFNITVPRSYAWAGVVRWSGIRWKPVGGRAFGRLVWCDVRLCG